MAFLIELVSTLALGLADILLARRSRERRRARAAQRRAGEQQDGRPGAHPASSERLGGRSG